ncbi:hypothetical protein B2G71_19085 [Novosphingobium sp. PC22D]|uniref:PilZ domain-containing protein n=1 Tax=Novosphingobium sp. PC22D TaxID=1962403 RepID=UPI000BF09F71|nr:PilZ domain-containing protein [Novosphingobium sp. PC22D]PEQ11143.1 hypothetical protein B2G71_19085 [Novosphingobium sp. PC22D]
MREHDTGDRLNPRSKVLLDARCRTSSWHVFQVELADFCEGGCRILGGAADLAEGQAVKLRIANLKPITGTVRWIRGADAGVEFHAALGRGTVASISAQYELG